MTNREIRILAWNQAKGRRSFLIFVTVLAFLPSELLLLAPGLFGMEQPGWWAAVVSLFSRLLGFGAARIAIEQLEGREKRLGGLIFWARPGLFWKTLSLAVLLWAVPLILTYLPGRLAEAGSALMEGTKGNGLAVSPLDPFRPAEDWEVYHRGSMLYGFGTFFSLGLSYLVSMLLFPLEYMISLWEDGPGWTRVGAAVTCGIRSGWRVIVHHFWMDLPLISVAVLSSVFYLEGYGWAILGLVLTLGFLVWYMPVYELALAGLAGELLLPGKWGVSAPKPRTELGREVDGFARWVTLDSGEQKKHVRAMKLCVKDGYSYCIMGKGPATGGPLMAWRREERNAPSSGRKSG